MKGPKILLIDIETAPTMAYIWDLFTRYVPHSQVVEPGYTMCWAAKWLGRHPMMFKSIEKHGEEDMIETAHGLLEEADVVIHYNGTKYDIPKLNQEFLVFGMSPPAPFQEVDLYKTAKQRFKLLSNSMEYLAKTLGVKEKGHTKGMSLWTECMDGDPKAWKAMERYNKQDVRVLEDIYGKLRPWVQPHPNLALYVDQEKPMCPVCGSTHLQSRGSYYTNTLRYPRFHCQDCGKWSRGKPNNLEPEKRRVVLAGVK